MISLSFCYFICCCITYPLTSTPTAGTHILVSTFFFSSIASPPHNILSLPVYPHKSLFSTALSCKFVPNPLVQVPPFGCLWRVSIRPLILWPHLQVKFGGKSGLGVGTHLNFLFRLTEPTPGPFFRSYFIKFHRGRWALNRDSDLFF
jgi:hypothetical protein